jgi:hypothetical protein
MSRLAVAVAVSLLAACSSSPRSGADGGGGSGGGAADLAPSGPPDLLPRSLAGIACGAVNCTSQQQLCCTGDTGITGDCQMASAPSCGAAEFACDGPEDCEPADPECCVQGGIAFCRPSGYCASKSGTFMCHTASDCPGGGNCCAAPNGSPYKLCLAQTCP